MPTPLPPISTVSSLPTEARASILDQLFEPSTALHTLSISLLHEQSFSSYDELIASIGQQLQSLAESGSTSDKEWLDKILEAHPRLGEKNVHSEQSQAEQKQLQLPTTMTGKEGEAEADELVKLNGEYEKTFDGLRYVYDSRP
ncbi:MAG: hypothetical protein M1816_004874 [Peltula sp. TS41687]|nr:MAG: hypothetical protein M1816_004874 [Peltula sp. TS41687]